MSDYTPTTEAIRGRIIQRGIGWGFYGLDEFDRWLAAHDAAKRAEWEAEQGDKPAPCVMTHTPPFNFAQCETHDETFPLGGACKWHGKESVAQVLQDEADEQRRRAVRAEHQLEILRAEQGEPEGRREFAAAYRARNGNVIPLGAETVVQDDANAVRAEFEREDPEGPAYFVATRILPPWLPVTDTTNNESEDEG